jgi:hypothetical protein
VSWPTDEVSASIHTIDKPDELYSTPPGISVDTQEVMRWFSLFMLLKIHNDCSVYKAPNEMNNELLMILEEAVVACFKTISWHFVFERLRRPRNTSSWQQEILKRLRRGIFRTQVLEIFNCLYQSIRHRIRGRRANRNNSNVPITQDMLWNNCKYEIECCDYE